MNKKQIRRDYENVDYVDEKGKVRTDVVYKGKYFDVEDLRAHKRHKAIFCTFSICLAMLFIVGMIPDSGAMRTIYFALPYALQAFPVLFILLATYKFLMKKLPYRQEVYDELYVKARTWCTIGAVLTAICVVAFIIMVATKGAKPLDALPICVDAISFGLYTAIVLSAKRWDIKEVAEEESLTSSLDAEVLADIEPTAPSESDE